MPGITFKFDGLNDVVNKLKAYGETVKQDLKDELNATAKEIVDDAQHNAPVDLSNLYQNIGSSPVGDGLTQNIYSTANYSAFVEFGTGTNVEFDPGNTSGSLEDFYIAYDQLVSYAAQFKGAGLEGKHPVNIKGKWVMVPFQLNLPAHPFFFPAVNKGTTAMVGRLKKLLVDAAG